MRKNCLILVILAFLLSCRFPGINSKPNVQRSTDDERVIKVTVDTWRERLPYSDLCKKKIDSLSVRTSSNDKVNARCRYNIKVKACYNFWTNTIFLSQDEPDTLLSHEVIHALHMCNNMKGNADHSSPHWKPHNDVCNLDMVEARVAKKLRKIKCR